MTALVTSRATKITLAAWANGDLSSPKLLASTPATGAYVSAATVSSCKDGPLVMGAPRVSLCQTLDVHYTSSRSPLHRGRVARD